MINGRLDEVDKKILSYLSVDARVSNREIADLMDVAEGTIRARIKRLQSENAIRIMAVADVRVQTGYENPMMAYVGIHAEIKNIKEVAEAVAKLPFVRFTATMLGRYDILAISYFGSNDELVKHVNEDIMTIKGVRHIDTKLAIKSLKYDYRWGRVI